MCYFFMPDVQERNVWRMTVLKWNRYNNNENLLMLFKTIDKTEV